MDGTRLAAGTVVGGVTLFVLGYLIFDVALGDFYVANSGSATGLWRNAPLWWAAILGTLAYGALITFAIGNASGASSPAACATVGATVGFLLWFTADFIVYSYMDMATLTRTVIDPLLEAVRGGVAGAVIAVALARRPVAVR
jgi:hypothetical protein